MKITTFPFQAKLCNEKIDVLEFFDMLDAFSLIDSIPDDMPLSDILNNSDVLKEIGFLDQMEILKGADPANSPWPLNDCYGGKENLYLNILARFLRNYLQSSEFDTVKDLLKQELSSIEGDLFYNDINLGNVFLKAQDSLRKTGVADKQSVSILSDHLTKKMTRPMDDREKQDMIFLCYYLFRFYPQDFDHICKDFEFLNTSIENFAMKMCYSFVGSFGIKALTHSVISKHTLDPQITNGLRRYTELFEIAVDLLLRLPVPSQTYTKTASGAVVLALMRTAYGLGSIDREKEFYSEDSLDFMSSLGTSFKSKKGHKPKHENCERFVQEAEELWKMGDKKRHNEMADYLLAKHNKKVEKKEEEEHHVTKSLLLSKLKVIAENYGLARGVKKRK